MLAAFIAIEMLIAFNIESVNDFLTKIKSIQWVTFTGVFAALIGAFATLIGIIIKLKFDIKKSNEDRRLNVYPHFKYITHEKSLLNKRPDIYIFMSISKDSQEYNANIHINEDNEETNANYESEATLVNSTIMLKNIGNGPALNMIVDNISYGQLKIGGQLCGNSGVLEKNSEFLMLIDLRIVLSKLNNDNLVKVNDSPILDYYHPETYTKGQLLSMNIKWNDLIGNKYEQQLDFQVLISLVGESKGMKWKYDEPDIRLLSIGDVKSISQKKVIK